MDNDVFTLSVEVAPVAPIFVEDTQAAPQPSLAETPDDSFTQTPTVQAPQHVLEDGSPDLNYVALPGGGWLHFDAASDPSHSIDDAVAAANAYYGGLDGIAFQAANFDGAQVEMVHSQWGFQNTGGWILEQG